MLNINNGRKDKKRRDSSFRRRSSSHTLSDTWAMSRKTAYCLYSNDMSDLLEGQVATSKTELVERKMLEARVVLIEKFFKDF